MTKGFSDTPNFENCYESAEYLGTWYNRDCYIIGDSLIVRHGNEDFEYSSYSNVGWNPFAPTCTVGALGNGRTRCEIDIEGIKGYDNDTGRAVMCALAFLGRQYLDNGCPKCKELEDDEA